METLPPEFSQSTAPPTTTMQKVFFGPRGLRAGWSIVLYVLVIIALLLLSKFELHWLAAHLHETLPGKNGAEFHPTLAIVTEAATLLIVVLATALMGFFEGHRVVFYGLQGRDRTRQFLIGLVTGFIFLSMLVGILVATHHLRLTRIAMPGRQATMYAAAWALFFLLVGLTEELMLRGYLLYTLARGIRFWPAAILLAALFGLLHKGNPGESPFGMLAAALIALVFSLSLWRLGHLWWAIGFHTAWDWAESFFYGTADSGTLSAGRLMNAHPTGSVLISGGATGPEGSAWVLLIVILAALFVWFTQPNHGLHLHGKLHVK